MSHGDCGRRCRYHFKVSQFRKCSTATHRFSRERRYNEAAAIYLAAYTYSLLSVAERSRVDAQVYSDMNGRLVGFSPFEFQQIWPQQSKAARRADAISDLGIPPAISDEVWRLPKSRRMLCGFKTGPNKLYSSYRSYDEATTQAKTDLESKGLDARGLGLSAR